MKIFSVTDPEFKPYGRVVAGLDTAKAEILAALANTPLPAATDYVAEDAALQELPAAVEVSEHLFGGMPCQLGWCNGHNTYLNCLEYHRDSEFNLGTEDFVLLLARQEEIAGGKLDTATVKAFRVPAGTLVEVYATTLHYAPCHVDAAKGFRVLVALPKGHLYRHARAHPIRQCRGHRIIVVTVQIKEGALHSHGGNGSVLCFVAHFISA